MKLLDLVDSFLFRPLVNIAYPQYFRLAKGYQKNYQVIRHFFF